MKLLIAALAACVALPAMAQENCAPRDVVTESLRSRYGESVQSMGMVANGTVLEMWANAETGTWSIMITRPDGISCLPASGRGFEAVDSPASPTGARL